MEATLHNGRALNVLESIVNAHGTRHLRLARTPGGLQATHPQMLFFHAVKLSTVKPAKARKRLAYARAVAAFLDASPEYDEVDRLEEYEDGERHNGEKTHVTLDFLRHVRGGMTWSQAHWAVIKEAAEAAS
jgi:hypothetical protein